MRRRLIVAIVAVVAGALLVAGGGTLALERQAAAQAAQDEIATQVRTIANEASFATRRGVLARIRRAARLSGAKAIRIGPDRTLEGQPPRPLTTADLHRPQLLSGQLVSGTRGDLAYAAVRVIPNATSAASRASRLHGATAGVEQPLVLVITRRFSGPIHGLYYLLIAVGGTLLAAVLVAAWLARRVTRPLQEAVNATRRIAAGDLAAAVPEAPGSYPELASLTSS
ncbi:MAG TPA: HAMP domain-containing protein, partial [Acidimicrobiales bacterium]|nr:HAMP domain-containing protein [Acidimicrobiales bacterium]